jgi:hypothetical protein
MTKIFSLLRRISPKPIKRLLRKIYAQQFRFGFSPEDLTSLSPVVEFSASNKKWNTEFNGGYGGWIPVPNHSHGYHGLLKQWWEEYGLGTSSLFISETNEVGSVINKLYPTTKILTTDYYLGLVEDGRTDIIWNLYDQIPLDLSSHRFSSIVCQATFEHLMDPVGVIRNFVLLLEEGGYIYMHTHTPMYPYHPWPKDYLRFFPDWFYDIPEIVSNIKLTELYCKEGHVFAVYHKISKD